MTCNFCRLTSATTSIASRLPQASREYCLELSSKQSTSTRSYFRTFSSIMKSETTQTCVIPFMSGYADRTRGGLGRRRCTRLHAAGCSFGTLPRMAWHMVLQSVCRLPSARSRIREVRFCVRYGQCIEIAATVQSDARFFAFACLCGRGIAEESEERRRGKQFSLV